MRVIQDKRYSLANANNQSSKVAEVTAINYLRGEYDFSKFKQADELVGKFIVLNEQLGATIEKVLELKEKSLDTAAGGSQDMFSQDKERSKNNLKEALKQVKELGEKLHNLQQEIREEIKALYKGLGVANVEEDTSAKGVGLGQGGGISSGTEKEDEE
jgi:hypothetical protein